MEVELLVLIFFIGLIASFLSGMLGIGGAIINYPLLLYVPPLLGFAAFSTYEVTGMNAIQVFFTTLTAVLTYRKDGYLNQSLALYMGTSILIGSFLGGYISQWMTEAQMNFIYAILATLASFMMFVRKPTNSDTHKEIVSYSKSLAMLSAGLIGVASGIIGAGGAFLLVPVMLVILKVPLRITIATSLAVTFLSSIGTVSAKLITWQVDLIPALLLVIASIIASPLGATLGKKLNPKTLQLILSLILLTTSVKIWLDVF